MRLGSARLGSSRGRLGADNRSNFGSNFAGPIDRAIARAAAAFRIDDGPAQVTTERAATIDDDQPAKIQR